MKIRFTVRARALWDDTGELIVDPVELQKLDGTAYEDETFSDYLIDVPASRNLPVSGGHLQFYYDHEKNDLLAFTEYAALRPLTATEIDILAAYTRGQWSDGIGENFSQLYASETGVFLEPEWQDELSVEVVP